MENNLPKISIVMPCFNIVNYIERSIRSVIEQDYKNIELFIKDGGSTDGTIDIIKYYAKKYPNLIRWVSSEDRGQTDAINYGLRIVKGDILCFLNGDDLYKRGALRKVSQYFAKNSNIFWAYGKADVIDHDDKRIREWITAYKNFWLKNYSYSTLLILNYISSMACFWRREAWKKTGEFDKGQYYVMDYDYWLRLGQKYKAGVIDEYIASFRIVYTTKSSMGFIQQFKDELDVAKKHTNNNTIIFLHQLHIFLIIFIYSILKFLDSFSRKRLNQQTNV